MNTWVDAVDDLEGDGSGVDVLHVQSIAKFLDPGDRIEVKLLKND
jgi:hypothetical protein